VLVERPPLVVHLKPDTWPFPASAPFQLCSPFGIQFASVSRDSESLFRTTRSSCHKFSLVDSRYGGLKRTVYKCDLCIQRESLAGMVPLPKLTRFSDKN
jgi:hypothetical protein